MIWYHGSPEPLTVLRAGSTITRNKALARVFSHKPAVVSMDDDGGLRHTGTRPGYLYQLETDVAETDRLPHPDSSMAEGLEWLTLKDFPLTLLTRTQVCREEFLSEAALAVLRRTHESQALHETKAGRVPPAPSQPILVYGTFNVAKAASMRRNLLRLPLRMTDLCGREHQVTEAEEDGRHPMENALCKALHYWQQLRQPVFSIDSGLYFQGVAPEDQPEVWIRRIKGYRMDDREMIAHYAALADKYGGSLQARYHNALCLVLDDTHVLRYEGEDLHAAPFLMVSTPHEKRVEGFPLDSLSVDITTGKYHYDRPVRPVPDTPVPGASIEPDKPEHKIEPDGFIDLFSRILPLLRSHCPHT